MLVLNILKLLELNFAYAPSGDAVWRDLSNRMYSEVSAQASVHWCYLMLLFKNNAEYD
jgi:hypothetical protein